MIVSKWKKIKSAYLRRQMLYLYARVWERSSCWTTHDCMNELLYEGRGDLMKIVETT